MAKELLSPIRVAGPSQVEVEDRDVAYGNLGNVVNMRTDLCSRFSICPVELGRGANAATHLCFPLGDSTGEDVVVKFFDPAKEGTTDSHRENLVREVSMLAEVQQHPNVVAFHGFFQSTLENTVWPNAASYALMMDYCGGGDLADAIVTRCKHPFCEASAAEVLQGLLSALGHVHGRGIVHRDVKAENILLTKDGRPILADFGLACYRSDGAEMTRRCGSPGYVAPELLVGRSYNEKLDIFGAGVVLYLLLHRKLPFCGPDIVSTIRRTVRCHVKFGLAGGHEPLSENCKACVLLLLRKDACERPDAAAALTHIWFQPKHLPVEPDECRPRQISTDTGTTESTNITGITGMAWSSEHTAGTTDLGHHDSGLEFDVLSEMPAEHRSGTSMSRTRQAPTLPGPRGQLKKVLNQQFRRRLLGPLLSGATKTREIEGNVAGQLIDNTM